ncbi:sensor histidine kinase [uncultured Jatrophihabitans sp.]|uniref:sensor histidine kinase n=1 Tax=uncultured Jatrophihabitans sp. TaxID=1610747 RepID=UPI0035CA254F
MTVASTAGAGRPGFPTAVLGAALATGVGTIPVFAGITENRLPTAAIVSAGWVALGLAAALLVDRTDTRRVGAVFAACAVIPALVGGIAKTQDADRPWVAFSRLWDRFDWLAVAAALVAIAWIVDRAGDRVSRRRPVWLVVWAAVLFGLVLAGRFITDDRRAALVTMIGLWAFAAAATRVLLARELRPIGEPLVDAALVVGAVAISAALGQGVRAAGRWADLPSPDASAAFVTFAAAALSWPLGLWLRRTYLERRYGRGTLTPADVAAITAGLHREADPRELLENAAVMVAAASGHRAVSIVLGADEPDDSDGVLHHALVVAGDRVGTLSIRLDHPEGPEPRQSRMVTGLLPTVSLVARAVGLAIEADHARQDVARERDLERSRILGDLHDGVGPVLAGLSMRVQAQLRRQPTPLLEAVAKELADCRGDLRRIVSGLTPSALHDGDLAGALARLVDSFASEGRTVSLRTALPAALAPEVTVAVYRCVAEGITNALRHGNPTQVNVNVRVGLAGRIEVDVCDDGIGGPVVPGVGLTSLLRRAEQLGGRLQVEPAQPSGVRLHVELPLAGAAA